MKNKLLLLIALQASVNKKDKYKLEFPCVMAYYDENGEVLFMMKTTNLVQCYKAVPVKDMNKMVNIGVIMCKSIAQMDLIYISEWLNSNPKNTSKEQRDLFKPNILFNECSGMFCEIESFCSYKKNEIIISKDEFQDWIHPSFARKQKAKALFEKIYHINYPSYESKLQQKEGKVVVEFWKVIKDEFNEYNIMSLVNECYIPCEIFKNAKPYSDGDWFKIPKDMKLQKATTYYLKVDGEWSYEFFYALDHLYFNEISENSIKMIKKAISYQNSNNQENCCVE